MANARRAMVDPAASEDVLLAAACAAGDDKAIAELERRCFPQARAAVTRIVGPASGDEAMQLLRHKLFVAEVGKKPRISEYEGRGSLAGWVRVVAVRSAISMKRSSKRDEHVESDDALLELPASPSPELEPFRSRYKAEFKTAFQGALASLSPRERNLLRLQFLDGLNIDQIGVIYRVHRATVARWIAKAREEVLDGTKQRLRDSLGITPSELTSIVALVQSQIDVSLHRFLEKGDPS